jgi:hypothetical protein
VSDPALGVVRIGTFPAAEKSPVDQKPEEYNCDSLPEKAKGVVHERIVHLEKLSDYLLPVIGIVCC